MAEERRKRPDEAFKREYAQWMVLSDREKKRNKLPMNHSEFARWKGVSDRTLRRWRTEPSFLETLSLVQEEAARRKVGAATRVLEPDVGSLDDASLEGLSSAAESEYRRVRATLAQMASDGSTDAMRLYMQYYGSEFARAEAEENQDLRGMSDEQLVEELVLVAGKDRVAAVLAGG